jgi:hypothetical protein
MWLLNPYRFAAGVALLLDLYPSAAAAYSLRLLRTAYNGPVIRVRRSSDNTEQDFTAAQVTDGTLTAFCGAGNGFVRTWYDQSGNGIHIAQTDNTKQPQTVTSGAVNTLNSRPAVKFDGSNDFLTGGDVLDLGSNSLSSFAFSDPGNNQSVYAKALLAGLAGRYNMGTFSGNTSTLVTTTASNDLSATVASLYGKALYSQQVINGASNKLFVNNIERASVNIPAYSALNNTSRFLVGAYNNSNDSGEVAFLGGSIGDLIIYLSNQSSNREGISGNINAHYGIY